MHGICRTPIEAADQNQQHAANFAASVAASVVLLLSSSCGPAAANPVFEGPARVVDGDTLYIGSVVLYSVVPNPLAMHSKHELFDS